MPTQLQLLIYEGYLADDPVSQFTQKGRQVTNFRIGSSKFYKTPDGEQKKETTWLKVACWGNLADIANRYCEKGSWVVVIGTLHGNADGSPNVYQLKNSEKWAASFEVTADRLRILKGRNGAVVEAEADTTPDADDDIPF